MEGIVSYVKAAYQELTNKVTWPTLAELQSSAVVVLVASAIIAVLILLMDFGSKNVATNLYKFLMSL